MPKSEVKIQFPQDRHTKRYLNCMSMFIVELIESHKADDILSKYFVGIDSDGRVNFDYPDGLDQGQLEEGLR